MVRLVEFLKQAADLKHADILDLSLKVHCIYDEESLPGDGILLRDTLWDRSVLDSTAQVGDICGQW